MEEKFPIKRNLFLLVLAGIIYLLFYSPANVQTNFKVGLYYELEGTFTVSGRIYEHEWKYQNEKKCWFGPLLTFKVNVQWPNEAEMKGFESLGFSHNKTFNRYQSIIKPKSRGYSLYVYVYGFSNKPGDLDFHQTKRISTGQPEFVPISAENFSIGNRKPDKIEFNEPIKTTVVHPVISIYFGDQYRGSSDALISQPGQETSVSPPTSSQQSGVPSTQIPATADAQSSNTHWGSNLGVELKNRSGIVIKNLIWNAPFEPINLPTEPGYTMIELIAPFGRCQLRRSRDNRLSIDNFITPLSIRVNETDAKVSLLYSADRGRTWSTFQILKPANRLTVCDIPKMVPNQSTIWKLTAMKEGFKTEEKELDNLSNFIISNINLDLTRSKFTIKTEPFANVSIVNNEHVLLAGEADREGKLDLPYCLKDMEIIVEKEGFKRKAEKIIDENFTNIQLEPTDKPRLNGIKVVGKEIYEGIGGNFPALTLSLSDINNRLLFNGPLRDADFVHEETYRFHLQDRNNIFSFPADIRPSQYEELEIDLRNFSRSINFGIELVPPGGTSGTHPGFNHATFRDSQLNTILDSTNITGGKFIVKVTFSYSCRAINDISANAKQITICCPGYRSESINLEPIRFSLPDQTVTMQPLPPEVVVIISGNISSNRGDYYVWSRDAVLDIWDTYSSRMHVGVSNEGKIYMMKEKRTLRGYGPSEGATFHHVNKEIEEAQKQFTGKEDECGNSPPRRLVYIGREPGAINQNNPYSPPIYIISSNPKPPGWPGEWYSAQSKNDIINRLVNILGGI